MKKIFKFSLIIFACLGLLTQSLYAQSVPQNDTTAQEKTATVSPEKLKYEKKYKTYTRMRNVGFAMDAAGLACLGVGTVLLVTTNWDAIQNNLSSDANNFQAVMGTTLVVVGVPLTVGGGVLTSLGIVKRVKYKRLLEQTSFNVKTTGLALTLKF